MKQIARHNRIITGTKVRYSIPVFPLLILSFFYSIPVSYAELGPPAIQSSTTEFDDEGYLPSGTGGSKKFTDYGSFALRIGAAKGSLAGASASGRQSFLPYTSLRTLLGYREYEIKFFSTIWCFPFLYLWPDDYLTDFATREVLPRQNVEKSNYYGSFALRIEAAKGSLAGASACGRQSCLPHTSLRKLLGSLEYEASFIATWYLLYIIFGPKDTLLRYRHGWTHTWDLWLCLYLYIGISGFLFANALSIQYEGLAITMQKCS